MSRDIDSEDNLYIPSVSSHVSTLLKCVMRPLRGSATFTWNKKNNAHGLKETLQAVTTKVGIRIEMPLTVRGQDFPPRMGHNSLLEVLVAFSAVAATTTKQHSCCRASS